MLVEERPSLKGIFSTLEEAQQRVSDADLIGASRSALASAREAVADGWPRRRRASRWPWVAGAVVGTVVLVVLLAPTFQRWSTSRRALGGPGQGTGDETADSVMPAADDLRDPADTAWPDTFDTTPQPDHGTE